MLLYTTFGTNDLPRALQFYQPTMATLGVALLRDDEYELGYGLPGDSEPKFWITRPFDRKPASSGNGTMIALTAMTRAAVNAFHTAALANGGTDEGAPGLRYAEHFYSCYVRDPDGNKLSAVCNTPE